MKVAIDPYMFRTTPLLELPGLVADLGYEYIELSPREDFTPFFLHPPVYDAGVNAFKKALDTDVTSAVTVSSGGWVLVNERVVMGEAMPLGLIAMKETAVSWVMVTVAPGSTGWVGRTRPALRYVAPTRQVTPS